MKAEHGVKTARCSPGLPEPVATMIVSEFLRRVCECLALQSCSAH